MMRNSLYSETTLVQSVTTDLRRRLPPDWSLQELDPRPHRARGRPLIDAALALTDPQGASATVVVEVKGRPLEAWQIYALEDWWQRTRRAASEALRPAKGDVCLLVVAPFVGPSARQRLAARGMSYGDATGNLRFTTRRPAVFIEAAGAARNPLREPLPLRSLKGGRAGRAVRALLDFRPPFGTRQLAAAAGCAPAVVSRVSDLLEREDILRRDAPRGPIAGVDWELLLRRWAEDYAFARANQVTPCLAPRGLARFWDDLRATELPQAVTGSFASRRYAPIAEPRLAAVYVDDPGEAMDALGLRPAEAGANVLLLRPFDPVVFDRAEADGGVTYAGASQVAVDLLTGPGRGPAEAEALIAWMRNEEAQWRRRP